MEVIALPICRWTRCCLTRSRFSSGRKAGGVVIRRKPDDWRLASVGQVRHARWKDAQKLRDIKKVQRIAQPTLAELRKHKVDLVHPKATQPEYEKYLDSVKRRFGVLAASDDTAIIVSRREDYMEEYNQGPLDCYCEEEGHSWPPPPGHSCKKCGSDIRCDKA
jgi:hypothetical protein